MKLSYKDEINNIIMDCFHESVISISECGNHDLNRNYVYQVVTESRNLIIKFYYKPNKRLREVNSLKHVQESMLQLERIGETPGGTEWSLYNYLKGEILETLYDNMTEEEAYMIFYEIGFNLGMLHSSKKFNYFGDWISEKQSPLEQYQNFIINDTERIIKNLSFLPESEQLILKYAIIAVREEYDNIRVLKVGRLCHRDYDGRNIIVDQDANGKYHFNGVLDFEKCVVFNEHYDIIGLYRKYFLYRPELVKPFFEGYTKKMILDVSFNTELRFNLFRMGLDLCSWSKRVSETFYDEVFHYLKYLVEIDGNFEKYLYK